MPSKSLQCRIKLIPFFQMQTNKPDTLFTHLYCSSYSFEFSLYVHRQGCKKTLPKVSVKVSAKVSQGWQWSCCSHMRTSKPILPSQSFHLPVTAVSIQRIKHGFIGSYTATCQQIPNQPHLCLITLHTRTLLSTHTNQQTSQLAPTKGQTQSLSLQATDSTYLLQLSPLSVLLSIRSYTNVYSPD